ncbi:MAG: NAD-dependent protein deacylase [Acutalibacter sp.]|nr:NAD-dependent protein deacylase [Acutalibacter sp.]
MSEIKNMETLKQWLRESKHTVFLGGAGVSTASGIPDFRSAYGLYREKQQGISYEEMLSHRYFVEHRSEFYDFMRRVMLYPDAKPNPAHYALAKLEQEGKLDAVITQNIDGLHQMAGSKNVIELHGNENRYFCLSCGKTYDMSIVLGGAGVPKCTCGGTIRPDVVLYGEQLDQNNLVRAVEYVEQADLLLVGGTSLVVYPAAGLVNYLSRSAKLVLLNRDETPYDDHADLVFREDLSEVLAEATGL